MATVGDFLAAGFGARFPEGTTYLPPVKCPRCPRHFSPLLERHAESLASIDERGHCGCAMGEQEQELFRGIKDWLATWTGTSRDWFDRNATFFDNARMQDETGFEATYTFGVACEGAYDWTSYITMGKEALVVPGWELHAYNGWLLGCLRVI